MHCNKRVFVFLVGVVLLPFVSAQPAQASKEGGLSLFSVKLDSPGMDESGPVHVEMKRSDEGIKQLIVSAFGRTGAAPSQLLESIKEKRWLNGIQLSWEKGYRLTGGRTVYVSLTEGGSWGGVVVAVIGFGEDGKFRVVENLSRDEVEEKAAKIANNADLQRGYPAVLTSARGSSTGTEAAQYRLS
jgi:hypothetical protein